MGYSGAWGKLLHEKNLKLKNLWHCPFKGAVQGLDQNIQLGLESIRNAFSQVSYLGIAKSQSCRVSVATT
jgi:hypothetical protein